MIVPKIKYSLCPILAIFFSLSVSAQKPLKVLCTALHTDEPLSDVNYRLVVDDNVQDSYYSSNGKYKFEINPENTECLLIIERPGFISKEILFITKDYPFTRKYNSQIIDLEFDRLEEESPHRIRGTFSFSRRQGGYIFSSLDTIWREYEAQPKEEASKTIEVEASVAKDTSSIAFEQQKKESAVTPIASSSPKKDNASEKFALIYQKAIKNGNGLWALEEYEYSRGYYEIALEAKPNDAYAQQKINSIDSAVTTLKKREELKLKQLEAQREEKLLADIGNNIPAQKSSSEITSPSSSSTSKPVLNEEKEWYSVQVGAFKKNYDPNVFSTIPDFQVIEGSDEYMRCFSGTFTQRTLAKDHLATLKNMGFNDAFVVLMRGKERIGY